MNMEYLQLKDVCNINMGQSPDSGSYNDCGDGLPFFQGNADFGERYPVTRVWSNAPIKKANADDILISVRAPIGALNYAKELCCIGRGLAALTPNKEEVSSEFIFWMLKGKNAELNSKGTGSTFKAISKKVLEEVKVPDIDLQTQMVYSGNLEKIYKIIQLRKQQLAKLDELVKARFVEMFDNNYYPKVLFDDVCTFLRNGANIKQTKGASGYPITRIETLSNDVFNVDRLGYADITDLEKYRSYVLHNGDILISHINSVAYLGRAVQYRGQLDSPIIHGMNLLCARIADSYSPTYIEWFFRTSMAKEYIASITKKAVNQASITTSDLKKMKVPNPPIDLQNQFATFVEQVDKSKVAVQKALDETQTLFDSLMQQYFG